MTGNNTVGPKAGPAREWSGVPEWITTQEAAEISGYNIDHIRRLMRQSKIKGSYRGVMWWVDRDSLKAYLDLMETLGTKRFHPGGIEAALEDIETER